MKTKKLIKRYYLAILKKNMRKAKRLYRKITLKSLKHKKTFAIQ